ncbi:MAG: outer membrane beta-barrel protein [Fluviicola sp.]|jgi:hypothetical protein
MKSYLLFFGFLFSFLQLNAQNASIEVIVAANKSGETQPGTYVTLTPGDKKAVTDIDGKVVFENLAAGTYSLSITNPVGEFQDKELTDIKLAKEEKKILNVKLLEIENIGTVVVGHTIKKDGEQGAVELQRKNVAQIEVISAEKIAKTPAKNAGDVIKLSSGASIQENKFAIIRGLNDRYNAAFLNGTALPSSESDRKAFSFDMFPSNMLDNLTISKTATADMPAEFAGGIIQINTRSIPEESFVAFSLGTGINSITTFKDRKDYKGSKTDFLGFDNGARALSSEIPTVKDFPTSIHDQADLAKKFSTSWETTNRTYVPNQSLQFTGGYVKKIDDNRKFGFIGALTYNHSYSLNSTIRRGYSVGSSTVGDVKLDYDYLDENNQEQVLAGAMLNLAYTLSSRTEISLKNTLSLNSDDRLIYRTGQITPNELNPQLLKSTVNWYTSNKIISSQLALKHESKNEKWKLNATVGLSNVKRSIPNLRNMRYTRLTTINDPSDPNPTDTMYVSNVSNTSIGPDFGGGMFFSSTNETSFNNIFDATYIVSNNEVKKTSFEIKTGLFTQNRSRDFFARQLGYTKYGVSGGSINFSDSLLYLPEDQIFAEQNMGLIAPGVGGFKLTDATKNTNAYDASSSLYAAYAQANKKFEKLRLVLGVRAEYFNQLLFATLDNNEPLEINTTKLDVLPSLNTIYEFDRKRFLRFSYSQTLNRPEYRELAPFSFYDFTTNFVVAGNDSLQRSKINNLDLRYEYYPGKGQLFTATVFYKHFTNPIEQISRPDVTQEVTFGNVPNAQSYGFEIEARSQLATIFKKDSTSMWTDFSIYGNLAIIRSKVNTEDVIGSIASSRTLQGQSPYVFNFGIQYTNERKNWGATLNLNRVGERIAIVGNVNEPDLIENSRTFLDLQMTKSFLEKRLDIKINIQNILAQDQIFYQNGVSDERESGFSRAIGTVFSGDNTNTFKFNENSDNQIWRTNFGRTVSFSISYKFK